MFLQKTHEVFFAQVNMKVFWIFFYVLYSALLHLPPLRFLSVSEDAGIEPRTVVTSALAVRSCIHLARSLPHCSARSQVNMTGGSHFVSLTPEL
jgi:hypothetical protein